MQRTRTRTARRIALTAAAVALAVAAPVAAAQAHSPAGLAGHSATADGAQAGHITVVPKAESVVRAGGPQSATDRVADFYGAYIDAVWDTGTDHLSTDLRAHYLTTGLQKKLATWEAAQHADGVLRAQDVPTAWRVTYAGSGAGHAFTTVRLTWGGVGHETYTTLKVQSDLSTMKISDIK